MSFISKLGPDTTPDVKDMRKMLELEEAFNRMDTFNPFGSTTYRKIDDGSRDGRRAQEFQFSPEVQPLFDRFLGMAGAAPSQFEFGGMPSKLKTKLGQVLGSVGNSQYTAKQWGDVDFSSPEADPEIPADTPPELAAVWDTLPDEVKSFYQSQPFNQVPRF